MSDKKKHNEWSVPRKKLSEKGIIDVETRGQISVRLPRFKEFVGKQFGNIRFIHLLLFYTHTLTLNSTEEKHLYSE